MAILMIRIEDLQSLPLNEFFDYNNHCYAMTRSRAVQDEFCINMEDFYEATFQTRVLEGVPVLFVAKTGEEHLSLLGFYQKAQVCRKVQRRSLFLEGNVIADASDAFLLDKPLPLGENHRWITGSQLYEVIEQEDIRFGEFLQLMKKTKSRHTNAFKRYPYLRITPEKGILHNYSACIERCSNLAAAIMGNECRDIEMIKVLEVYAAAAASLRRNQADGNYYLAMAYDQLGFVKQGMKAIEKALHLEPDAPDLHGQKASLLVGMGYLPQAAAEYHLAHTLSGEEDYLLMEGRVWLMAGKVQQGYECFKAIDDTSLLENAGISLKSLERRWPFINIRGFHFRNTSKG